jgi:hypothetical protein
VQRAAFDATLDIDVDVEEAAAGHVREQSAFFAVELHHPLSSL